MKNFLATPYVFGLLAVKPTNLSSSMHNAAFKALKLNYFYTAFDTDDTRAAISAVRTLGIKGLSVTIPHKEEVMYLLDEREGGAGKIRAINTIVNDGEKLSGYNTDSYGVVEAIKESGVEVNGTRVILYGAGGASRACVYALQELGVKDVLIYNRTYKRAKRIADDFDIKVIREKELIKELESGSSSLFINSTPIGSHLRPNSKYPFPVDGWKYQIPIFDMVTKKTELIKEGEKRGVKVIEGARMLLHQAIEQCRLFTKRKPPIKEMEKSLYKALYP